MPISSPGRTVPVGQVRRRVLGHRARGLLGGVGTALVMVSGCGAEPPPPGSVAWVDAVCGSIVGYTQVRPPAADPADPAAAVAELLRWTGQTGAALDSALSSMARVGTSPVAGGDALVAQLVDRLGRYRDGFADATAKLADLDPADPDLAGEVNEALAPLQDLGAAPTVDLDAGTALGRAADAATSCRQIRTATT
ncbi:MAG TPA: hypothetical protein VM367_02385 [Pseudonocardia sp.]|jgi:hypothetical protein|nr:hypothetical protein [Pseudonocardia sp.]